MFDDGCTNGRDKMSQSLCSFQESMITVVNSLKTSKIKQKDLEKIIQKQLLDVKRLQRECEGEIHFLESIPEERKTAFEAYDKASVLLNDLQRKQLNINDLLDKSMKMYDFICISVDSVQNDFKIKLEMNQNCNILYEKDIQDVKNVGNSTNEMLKQNLNDKKLFLDHLKKLNQNKTIYNEKELNNKINLLDIQHNDISTKLNKTQQIINNLNENISKLKIQENTLDSKLKETNIKFESDINDLNIISDEKNNEINIINERLKEQLLSINCIKNTIDNTDKKYNDEKKLLSFLQDELNNNLNEKETLNIKIDELSTMRNNLTHTSRIVDETKCRIINLKNDYDKQLKQKDHLNHEILNIQKKLEENKNQIQNSKSKYSDNLKLSDYILKLQDNIDEMNRITKDKILFKDKREDFLKKMISQVENSMEDLKRKKLSRVKYLENLQGDLIDMEKSVELKMNKKDKLDKEYNKALTKSKETECLKYEIEIYYDLLNHGIEAIASLKNIKEKASYLSKKLKNTNNDMEEIQNTFKNSLKMKVREVQELKFKVKNQVEKQKEILGATQYDYYMAKVLLNDEKKTEDELIAINDVVSCETGIFKSLVNWVKVSSNSGSSQKIPSQISQKRTQESRPKSQCLSQKNEQVVSSATGDMRREVSQSSVKTSIHPFDMDIDTDIHIDRKPISGMRQLKMSSQVSSDMDIDRDIMDRKTKPCQIPKFETDKNKNDKKTKKVRFMKKQHDQVKSLIDIIHKDQKKFKK